MHVDSWRSRSSSMYSIILYRETIGFFPLFLSPRDFFLERVKEKQREIAFYASSSRRRTPDLVYRTSCEKAKGEFATDFATCSNPIHFVRYYIHKAIVRYNLIYKTYFMIHSLHRNIAKNQMLSKVVCLVLLVVVSSRGAQGMCPMGTNISGTSSVTGEASRYVPPDVAKMTLSIKTTASSSGEAIDLANSLIDQLSQRLDGFINLTSIQRLNFQLTPADPANVDLLDKALSKPEPYTFSQNMEIITTPDKIADLVDIVIESGDGQIEVNGVVFYVSRGRATEVMNELRIDAVENGKNTATIIARAAGLQLGAIVSVSDSSFLPSIPTLDYSYNQIDVITATVYLETELCM